MLDLASKCIITAMALLPCPHLYSTKDSDNDIVIASNAGTDCQVSIGETKNGANEIPLKPDTGQLHFLLLKLPVMHEHKTFSQLSSMSETCKICFKTRLQGSLHGWQTTIEQPMQRLVCLPVNEELGSCSTRSLDDPGERPQLGGRGPESGLCPMFSDTKFGMASGKLNSAVNTILLLPASNSVITDGKHGPEHDVMELPLQVAALTDAAKPTTAACQTRVVMICRPDV